MKICDTIRGNESLVEKFQFLFFYILSHNFKMLHFNANSIKIGYKSYEEFVDDNNNIKQFANISKTIFSTFDSFLLTPCRQDKVLH